MRGYRPGARAWKEGLCAKPLKIGETSPWMGRKSHRIDQSKGCIGEIWSERVQLFESWHDHDHRKCDANHRLKATCGKPYRSDTTLSEDGPRRSKRQLSRVFV
jgi:hypothetical protein